MGTKRIGITEDVYDRLAAEKREDESFTDTIARLLDAVAADWRRGFGRYAGEEGKELQQVVEEVRRSHAEGFANRQEEVLEAMDRYFEERGNAVSAPDEAERGS